VSLVSVFFFSSRRRHTRSKRDWSSDVCSSDLNRVNIWRLQKGKEFHTLFAVSFPYPVLLCTFSLFKLAWKKNRHIICTTIPHLRSEERRVGKESRSQRWREA